MSFVDWSESYTVNNTTLDAQHQKLFKIVNELYDAMFAHKGKEHVATTLRELIEYARTHFAEEERQMAAHDFPGLAEHKAVNQHLIKVVMDIESRHHQDHDSITSEVFGLLVNWLLDHILGMDKLYAPFLKNRPGIDTRKFLDVRLGQATTR